MRYLVALCFALYVLALAVIFGGCGSDRKKAVLEWDDKKEEPGEVGKKEEPEDVGGIVSQHGFLTASDSKVVDKNGKPFQLRGFSLFWSQWSESFYIPETVAEHKRLGANVVRAAMGVEMGGYLDDKSQVDRIETVIEAAIKEDIYVIVDWHAHGEYVNEAEAFFIYMAKKYGKTPHVIFELWNEPVFTSWDSVRTYSEIILDSIRELNAQNLVIVGSPSWSQRVDEAAANPVRDLSTAYSVHFYAATHGQWLRDRVAAAMRSGIAIVATEWGTCDASGNGRIDLGESEKWLTFLAANDIGWANWSWFDKPESASALKPQTSPFGPYKFTTSGAYVAEKFK